MRARFPARRNRLDSQFNVFWDGALTVSKLFGRLVNPRGVTSRRGSYGYGVGFRTEKQCTNPEGSEHQFQVESFPFYTGMTQETTSSKVVQRFAHDVPVHINELALAMRVSRWTVYRWKENGYRCEFGRRTPIGHLKAWLREQATSGRFEPVTLIS
jgi:hypothetical protein